MLARCDECGEMFDSKDGGTVINGKTYCPKCEPIEEEAEQEATMSAYELGLDRT